MPITPVTLTSSASANDKKLATKVNDLVTASNKAETDVTALATRVTKLETPTPTPVPPPPAPKTTFVAVTLSAPLLTPGKTTTASAIAKDANGSVMSGRTVQWSSLSPTIATVTANGTVTAVAAGSARIVATIDAVTGYAELSVIAADPVVVVPVTPSAIFTKLIGGPIPTVAEIRALGPAFAEYEDDFSRYADYHWSAHGAAWEYANYYDRAAIYFVWYARTGDQRYLDRGSLIAIDYRTKFLESQAMPYTYNASTYWHMPLGLALHYLLKGDEASRKAVGYSAEWVGALHMVQELDKTTTLARPGTYTQSPAAATIPNPIPVGLVENRWRARILQAFVLSHAIGAPQNGPATGYGQGGMVGAVPGTWAEKAKLVLDKILAAQGADGAYRDTTSGGASKPFMDGLLNDALILYHQNVNADARILPAVKKNLEYNWTNVWLGHRESSESFAYYEYSYTSPVDSNWSGGRYPAGDLNQLMTNGFAWVYAQTKEAVWLERARRVFAGGVALAYVEGSKQFNQSYTSSFRALPVFKAAGA